MLLKALIVRPARHDKLRTALTVAGVSIGVAVIVAIQLSNQSALRAFRESVDAVAGRANYQIVGEAGSLDEELLLRLQPLWADGVRFAPVIDVDGVVEPQQLPIRLLAVDLLSDLHFRDYRYARVSVAGSASPAGPAGAAAATRYFELFLRDSVILPAPFANEHRLNLGSPITMNILGSRRTMIVRGILQSRGPATAFNGSIAVCDIATAQKSFGMIGRLSRIDLLVPEARGAEILTTIRAALPPATRIERPSRRNERVEKMLRAFRVNLFALAGVALLVGMLLVYNTVLISILRRRRDVGIVKALGASPRQIFAVFLAEGLLLGILGSVAGIAIGNALAYAILGLVGRTINSLYIASTPEAIALSPGIVLLAIVVGIVLSLLSAIQPSLEAARFRPDVLIRPGLQQRVSIRNRRRLALYALLALATAALTSFLPPVGGVAIAGYIAVLLVVAGFSLLAPGLVRLISTALSPPLRRLFGVVGQLAAASLPASLRRTSIASAALSLATGMMVAVALMVGSFRATVNIWVRQTVQSDLWLRPSKGLSNAQAALFPPSILDDLRRFDFIEAVDPVRGRDVLFGDALVTVGSGDFAVAAQFGDLPMVAPRSARDGLAEALRRHGVFISESFAIKFRKRVGDSVVLPTASGNRRFPITGIYRDYSNDRGVVAMDRSLYVRLFRDDAINTVVVFLKPIVDHSAARARLEQVLGPKYHAFAITNAEIRREVMKIFDQTFSITYALLGVAIVVAVLGIINTLSALILERTRELALLHVSGVSARELRTMLVLESTLLGLASTVAGAVMGYILSIILIYVINKQSFGWTIEFHTPVTLIAASLAITFAAAALSGLIPARLASRVDIAAAIKME